MSERIIRETYTKEIKKRDYDDVNRHIDRNIVRGKEKYPQQYQYVKQEKAPSSRLSHNDLKEMRKSVDALHELVASELERKREQKMNKCCRSEDFRQPFETIIIKEQEKQPAPTPIIMSPPPIEKIKELDDILSSQKVIQDQLREQRDVLTKMEGDRKEADRQLRDDVGDALREHKEDTDGAIQHLAEKISDLVSENEILKEKVYDLANAIDQFYVDVSEDEEEKPKTVAQKRKARRASTSSSSSGSMAVVLPPATVTDGRRPSQAVIHHSASSKNGATSPPPDGAATDKFAEETAKTALADATRITTRL